MNLMSFFNFSNKNKFEDLAKILSHNEQTSKISLHEKHPHTKSIFTRHNINLRQIRNKGVKATATATVLGAFLAFPHLLGHGALNEKTHNPNVQPLNTEKQVNSQNNLANHLSKLPTNVSSNLIDSNNKEANSTNPAISDKDKHKSQGHIHGRSYLAPPKEHGFHDLGLHKGEDKGRAKSESPGPHPEDLEINHPEKKI